MTPLAPNPAPAGERKTPGTYPDVPFAEYLTWPLMSQSVVKKGRREGGSMRKLKCAIDGDNKKPPTDLMILGSGLHCCFLEPELMPTKIALWEGSARRGAEWEEFKAEHAGKAILTQEMHRKLTGMVKALRRRDEIREWASRIEAVELSCVGEIDGVPFKARCDGLTDDPIWDLKKFSSVDDRTVDQTIWTMGYHIQGYVYTTLFNRSRFCLGLVEDSEPYETRVIELSPRWLEIGRLETRDILRQVKECASSKPPSWPERYTGIDVVEPPAFVEDRFGSERAKGITIGGVAAF